MERRTQEQRSELDSGTVARHGLCGVAVRDTPTPSCLRGQMDHVSAPSREVSRGNVNTIVDAPALSPDTGGADAAIRMLAAMLARNDIHAVLEALNHRTRFRFTGVYQVIPPRLRNVHLFDRENPRLNVSGDITSLDIGYCGITCGSGQPFLTGDARRDPRLRTHPARTSMISYVGVPIRTNDGIAWGTLCHFDMRPRLIPVAEIPILTAVSALLAEWVRQRQLLA